MSSAKTRAGERAADLSVVIVSYNVRDLLRGCLESIETAAGAREVEVLVVDNASSDGSADMVRKCFPRYTVIDAGANLGFSRANNLGLARAKGRYLLLLNPDTVLEKGVLAGMTDYMDRHRAVGMATCRLVTVDGSLDLACRRSMPSLWDGFCRAAGLSRLFPQSRLFARYNLTYLDEGKLHEVEAVNGAFMFVRREAFEDAGPLDEDYFMYVEDLDWCLKFRKAGWKIVYNPAFTSLHLKGQSGRKRSSAMIRRLFASTELFYRKNFFPRMNPARRLMILGGLRCWKGVTLLRNSLRKEKRTRP